MRIQKHIVGLQSAASLSLNLNNIVCVILCSRGLVVRVVDSRSRVANSGKSKRWFSCRDLGGM